jgi:hypothetical protein
MTTKKNKPWEEIRVRSWEHFDEVVESLDLNKWLFRGQSDSSFELKTSIYRLFEDAQPIIENHFNRSRNFARDKHENLTIKKFQENAHLYRSPLPSKRKKLEWLSLMQHHGAPTRLLDVTLSPYIATYFALETGHGPFCIFAFNHIALKELDNSVFSDVDLKNEIFNNQKEEKSFLIPYAPEMTNERLVAQQGLFLIPSNNYETFEQILDYYGLDGKACKKIIIPAKLRLGGIERLKRMNITSSTLFPGMDGFCRSLRFQVFEPIKVQQLLP